MFKIHQSKAQGKCRCHMWIIRVKLSESCQIRLALGSVQLMGLLWLASYSGFDYESRNLPCFKSHYLSLFSSKHQCTRRLSTRREASTGIRFLNVIGALSGRPMKMDWYTNKRFGMVWYCYMSIGCVCETEWSSIIDQCSRGMVCYDMLWAGTLKLQEKLWHQLLVSNENYL